MVELAIPCRALTSAAALGGAKLTAVYPVEMGNGRLDT
jgi:hypothetical protein